MPEAMPTIRTHVCNIVVLKGIGPKLIVRKLQGYDFEILIFVKLKQDENNF